MLEKDMLSWSEIFSDILKHVFFISATVIMAPFALDCFEMLSFSLAPTPQHSQKRT